MANEKRKVIRKSNMVDFLSVIRRYNENWSSCCCSCRVLNGDCNKVASEGLCRAWNGIQKKDEALAELTAKAQKN